MLGPRLRKLVVAPNLTELEKTIRHKGKPIAFRHETVSPSQAHSRNANLETGNWKLVVGSGIWDLETGNWKLETGNWKLETGNWKLETGNWKLDTGWIRNLESGNWKLVVGSGVRVVESGNLESGNWKPEYRIRISRFGHLRL